MDYDWIDWWHLPCNYNPAIHGFGWENHPCFQQILTSRSCADLPGEPLFSSHMLDLSEESWEKRMADGDSDPQKNAALI